MKSVAAVQPEAVHIGSERALIVEEGSARVLFGMGPAHGAAVFEDRIERLLEALSPAVRAVRWARQVHGSALCVVAGSAARRMLCVGSLDAMATAEIGIGLMVWTADCVPVVLVGRHAVAVAHAGWRGCASGIVPRTVESLEARLETPASELSALLGPAISAAHYAVGPEVIAALDATGVPGGAWRDGRRVDLRSFLAEQLRGLGVRRVAAIGPCTFASAQFASFRRDGEAAGRQWSVVYRMENDDPLPG